MSATRPTSPPWRGRRSRRWRRRGRASTCPVANNRRASSAAGRGPDASAAERNRSWPIPVSARLSSNRTTPGDVLGFSVTATSLAHRPGAYPAPIRSRDRGRPSESRAGRSAATLASGNTRMVSGRPRTRMAVRRRLAVHLHAPSPDLVAQPTHRPRRARRRPPRGTARLRQVVARPPRRGQRRPAPAAASSGRWRRSAAPHRPPSLIDDAHLLSPVDVDMLIERIEDAVGEARLVIAGRIVADEVHEAAQLVDGRSSTPKRCRSSPRRSSPSWPASSTTMAAGSSTPPTAASASSPRRSIRLAGSRPPTRWRSPRRWSGRRAKLLSSTSRRASAGRRPRRPGSRHRPPAPRPPRRCRVRPPGGGRRRAAASPDHGRLRHRHAPRRSAPPRSTRRSPPRWPRTCSSAGRSLEAIGLVLEAGDHEPGDHDVEGAQRVDHRHCRAAPDAQPARPPRLDHRPRAGAVAAAGERHAGDRARRRGRGGHRPRRRRWPSTRRRRCDGGWRSSRRAPASPTVGGAEAERIASRRSPSSATARPDLRRRPPGARRVRGDIGRPRGPAARRRELPGRRQRVGVVRGVRPCPDLPQRPRTERAHAARTLRRGAGSGRASCSGRRTCPTPSGRGRCTPRASCCSTPTGWTARSRGSPASPTSATCTTTPV